MTNGRKKGEFSDTREAPFISIKERERLLVCQTGARYELRNKCLLRLGFATGLRACELRDLCFYNIFDSEWQILDTCYIKKDQTKGGYGEGNFFLTGKKTRASIMDYLEWRRKKAKEKNMELSLDDPFFYSQKSRRFKQKDLIILIKRIFRQAGVEGSSHSFRRTFATNFCETNSDPKALQFLLRHKSPVMSLRYVYRDSEKIRKMLINSGTTIQD